MGKKPDAMVFLTFASLICRLHPANRTKLEACKDLDVWISKVFGTDRDGFSHRRVFVTPHPARMPVPELAPGIWNVNICVKPNRKILFCHLTACLENVYNFVCVYPDGKVVFEHIFFEDDEAQFVSTKTINGVNSTHFFGVGEGIINYESQLITFITINLSFPSQSVKYRKLNCIDWRSAVHQLSWSILRQFPPEFCVLQAVQNSM
jgi:hypothetical protein